MIFGLFGPIWWVGIMSDLGSVASIVAWDFWPGADDHDW